MTELSLAKQVGGKSGHFHTKGGKKIKKVGVGALQFIFCCPSYWYGSQNKLTLTH